MTNQTEDAITRVKSLIAITEDLTAIFKLENSCLENHRPSEILPFQEEKAKLAAAYAQSIRNIATDRSSLNGTDHSLMATLRDLTKSFEASAQKQRALLDGAKMASEGVLSAVVKEAASQESKCYNDAPPQSGVQRGVPLVLNEQA